MMVDLSGGEKLCANLGAHVTVATGTRAVLATSTHEKSIVPKHRRLQAMRKLIPFYLLAGKQVAGSQPVFHKHRPGFSAAARRYPNEQKARQAEEYSIRR